MNKINTAFELINLFYDHNYDAYLVGGSVRDILMDREIKDIDITTNATPQQIIQFAIQNNLKYIETGISHGTVTIIYKDIPIEVTTFRVDKNCDGRHCEVEFVRTLEEDLSRRDFTMNAIAINKDGQLIDPFNGIKDIENKIIRTVGNPDITFKEDNLRVTRAIVFETELKFEIEKNTFNAMRKVNLNITHYEFFKNTPQYEELRDFDFYVISRERIRDSLIRILLSPNRIKGIATLDNTNLLNQILPEVSSLKGVEQDEINHPEKDAFVHTILALDGISDNNASLELILGILLHDIGKPLTRDFISPEKIHFYGHDKVGAEITESILTRLKFPSKTIDKVKWLVENHMRIHLFDEMKKSKKVKLIEHKYFPDLLKLMIADINGSSGINKFNPDYTIVDTIGKFVEDYKKEVENRPALQQKLINGYDIMNLGVSPKEGIKIGQILEKVNDVTIEGIVNTKEEALEFVKGLI